MLTIHALFPCSFYHLSHINYVHDFLLHSEMLRAGYPKADLKPLGVWPHDGEWQNYNQYWNCCFSLEKKSQYCAAHV